MCIKQEKSRDYVYGMWQNKVLNIEKVLLL